MRAPDADESDIWYRGRVSTNVDMGVIESKKWKLNVKLLGDTEIVKRSEHIPGSKS